MMWLQMVPPGGHMQHYLVPVSKAAFLFPGLIHTPGLKVIGESVVGLSSGNQKCD